MEIIKSRYELHTRPGKVEAYSIERIPFGPKVQWKKDFLADMKQALSSLTAEANEGLVSIYGSSIENEFIDTENALLYNIGTGTFGKVAHHTVGLQTIVAAQTRQILDAKGKARFQHYYCYEILPVESIHSPHGNPVLEWKDIPLFSIRGEHKPFEYWQVLRNHPSSFVRYRDDNVFGNFAFDISIHMPETTCLNLANPMKALLDGVICAFHRMPSSVAAESLGEVATRLGCSLDELTGAPFPLLGEEEYVKSYRNSVIWNPQDDRCKEVRLSIIYEMPTWSFSGTLYDLERETK